MKSFSIEQAAKVSELLTELKGIEKDLVNLDKRAKLAVEEDNKTKLHVCAPIGHTDGLPSMLFGNSENSCLNVKITSTTLLQVIGVIISEKNLRKKQVLHELKFEGFQISEPAQSN